MILFDIHHGWAKGGVEVDDIHGNVKQTDRPISERTL